MRKTKFWILGIILALIYSCSDDFLVVEQSPRKIDVSEVRAYFEKYATDLTPLTFKDPLSRFISFGEPELIPEWDRAIEFENEDYLITEVLLHSLSNAICVERIIKDAEFRGEKDIFCQRRLVIARQKGSEEIDMFVATLVPDDDFVGGEETLFSGRVFYSELNGDFRKAVGYKEGQIEEKEQIKKAVSCAVCTQEGVPLDYSTCTFLEVQTSRSATYSSSESGGEVPGWTGGGISGGSIGGGGTGGGSGGGGVGYDPDYELGQQSFERVRRDLVYQNVQPVYLHPKNAGYHIVNGFSIGVNTNGIIASCLNFMNQNNIDVYAKNFGRTVGILGAGLGWAQTIIAFTDSNIPNPNLWDVALNVLNTAGVICGFIPALIPLAGVIGIATCVIGIVMTTINYTKAQLIQVPLDDGSNIYIYISPNIMIA